MARNSTAPGKIILTGEYAVVFGYPGIAVPSPLTMTVTYKEAPELSIAWEGIKGDEKWDTYIRDILTYCKVETGKLRVHNEIPLGKGMGASTALLIAVMRCLLGADCEKEALAAEDALNPGHSGIDFSVIWSQKPVLYEKGKGTEDIDLPTDILKDAVLIDTGKPNESTPQLVAEIKEQQTSPLIYEALKTIAGCTTLLRAGQDLKEIIREHHRAQVALGIVPKKVQDLIAEIEEAGGAAKVIGAGGKAGCGGIVLSFHENPSILEEIATEKGYPLLSS